MKVNYVKLGFLALLFICVYSNLHAVQAEVVWSDDFDDGDYEGWPAGFGDWAVINGTLQGQEPGPDTSYCLLKKPSTVAYGTWSFDVYLQHGKSLSIAFINNNETFSTYGHWYELGLLPRTGSTKFEFVKVDGSYSDTKEYFIYHNTEEELHDAWHHIDITRELDGRFSFYLDAELLFDVIDNNIVTSEEFAITSHPEGAFIDNILVNEIVKDPMEISIEIEESAIMDGASRAMIFYRIILPLAQPAIAVTALFSFMTGWNEFILASIFMEEELLYTAPVGLRFFVGGFSQQWGYFAAGSIIVSIPVVILFMFTQKYLISGLTAGGVKG